LVDTSTAAFIDGDWVKCKFTYTVDGAVIDIQYDPIFIGEEKL